MIVRYNTLSCFDTSKVPGNMLAQSLTRSSVPGNVGLFGQTQWWLEYMLIPGIVFASYDRSPAGGIKLEVRMLPQAVNERLTEDQRFERTDGVFGEHVLDLGDGLLSILL